MTSSSIILNIIQIWHFWAMISLHSLKKHNNLQVPPPISRIFKVWSQYIANKLAIGHFVSKNSYELFRSEGPPEDTINFRSTGLVLGPILSSIPECLLVADSSLFLFGQREDNPKEGGAWQWIHEGDRGGGQEEVEIAFAGVIVYG